MSTSSSHSTGTVKWYSRAKGFGFITPDDGTHDVFVHHTALEDPKIELNMGDRVEFHKIDAQKGPKAADVVLIA